MKNSAKPQLKNSTTLFSFLPVGFVISSISNYIDLGTGSLVIQVLIAGFIGGLFLLKVYWGKVKLFFKNLFSKIRKSDD